MTNDMKCLLFYLVKYDNMILSIHYPQKFNVQTICKKTKFYANSLYNLFLTYWDAILIQYISNKEFVKHKHNNIDWEIV